MSESQGYKLGMKMGLTNKSALFAKIRREGSKREVELLMGNGPANTAFRRGLKSAAFELSRGKRRPATRKKTTRQRLTTAKRAAAKRKRKNPDQSRINSDTNATVDGIEVSRVPDSPEKGVTEYYLVDFRGSIEEAGPGGLWYDGAFAHRVPGGFLVVDGLAIHKFYKRLPTAAQVAKLIGENYSGYTEDAYLIPKSGVIQFAGYKNSKHFD
jgi:hypothetical protein